MRPELSACAASHGGVFTRGEALTTGYAVGEIRRLTRPGAAWVVVRRGVYAERSLWESMTDDGRYGLEVRAALLGGHGDSVASHQSGGVLLGMPMRPFWRRSIHTTRTGVQGTRRETGVRVHPAPIDERDLVEVDGFLATGLARSAIDIARDRGYQDGLCAADAALRQQVPRAELERVLGDMGHWPGVTVGRAATEDADDGAANMGETLSRELAAGLGLGRPETQYEVTDGVRTAYADLRIGPLLIEFDGRVKYLTRELGGVSTRPPELVVWQEKQREDWLRRFGYSVERIIWEELFGAERRATERRLRAAYCEAVRRVGPGSPLLIPGPRAQSRVS